MEKLATLIDPGTIAFGVNYDNRDATHQFASGLWRRLIELIQNDYGIWLPNDPLTPFASMGIMYFTGYVSSHSFTLPVDNVIDVAVEVLINGAITTATQTVA